MRRAALTIVAACALFLTACANQPTTASTPAATPAATSPAAVLEEVGRVVHNREITLTVTKVSSPATIEMNESNFRPGSGYESYTSTAPQASGRYVRIDVHVVNDAKESLDLTCGLPISTKLVDSKDRNFDPIDDLYKLKGNPECNKQLQPGFESDMSYVYEVPTSASIVSWAFQDSTDLSRFNDSSWTFVRASP